MQHRKKEVSDGVAIYARYSTDRQSEKSLEDQTRRVQQRALDARKTVLKVFGDAAISGSHTERAGLIALLEAAKAGEFSELWVDDLSRLSREMGATWQIVFGDLAALGIKTYDCSSGIYSTDQGARLSFGMKALMNEQYIEAVSYQTRRGLEGLALLGFWTGGRVYGFKSIPEPNPPNPQKPRMIPAFDAEQVAFLHEMARRALDLGLNDRKIATWLNDSCIPAPHDGGKGNKAYKGWGHTTIRAMFKNRRYIGEWDWGTRKWVKVPSKNSRRPIPQTQSKWTRRLVPELAIFDADTWNRLQARYKKAGTNAGSTSRGSYSKNPSILSGLLQCGPCSGAFVMGSRNIVRGVTYQNLACGNHRNRSGAGACSNNRYVSEKKIVDKLAAWLSKHLLGREAAAELMNAVKARFADQSHTEVRAKDLRARMAEQDRKISNLTSAIGNMGGSESLCVQLRTEEEGKKQLARELTELRKEQPNALPSPERVRSVVSDLVKLLKAMGGTPEAKDITRGSLKELLGALTLNPQEDGSYLLTGALDLLRVEIVAPRIKAAADPLPDPQASTDNGLSDMAYAEKQRKNPRISADLSDPTLLKSSGGGLLSKSASGKLAISVVIPQWGAILSRSKRRGAEQQLL